MPVYKFTHSENYRCNSNGQKVPKPLITKEAENEIYAAYSFVYDNYKVFDADQCGEIEIEFLFDTGVIMKMTYSWYLNFEQEEHDYIIDNFCCELLKKTELSLIERDWLCV